MSPPVDKAVELERSDREQTPLAARQAYDLFADRYDKWIWQEFWHRNEWPHVRALVDSAQRGATVLDVGTGTGFYLSHLSTSSRMACGMDISHRMLCAARRRLGDRTPLVQADAALIPFRSGTFDVVLLNRVATHVPDLERLATELARILANSGLLIVSDLAPEHPYTCTEFEASHSWVLVETYKHSVDDWRRAGGFNGLAMVYSHVISASNASWLPSSGFTSIDRSGNRPIGFVVALKRN